MLSLQDILDHCEYFQDNPTRRKRLRALASLHYQKALEFFSPRANPLEYLRSLIEEVALADFELQSNRSSFSSIRNILLFFRCHRQFLPFEILPTRSPCILSM